MKKYQSFLSDNFQFLEVKLSINSNRRVFVIDIYRSLLKFRPSYIVMQGQFRQSEYYKNTCCDIYTD